MQNGWIGRLWTLILIHMTVCVMLRNLKRKLFWVPAGGSKTVHYKSEYTSVFSEILPYTTFNSRLPLVPVSCSLLQYLLQQAAWKWEPQRWLIFHCDFGNLLTAEAADTVLWFNNITQVCCLTFVAEVYESAHVPVSRFLHNISMGQV